MAILLLRLAGPMQSWGTQSRFTHRDTGLEPSKSGVVGLLCAALGKPHDETERPDLPLLEELANLKMGIRVDWQGIIECDYHTAQNVAKAGGGKSKECELSQRFYLADAVFLVALEGKKTLLERLDDALTNPVWQLYLGRKAFVPGAPVQLPNGLKSTIDDMKTGLQSYPYLCPTRRNLPNMLRLEIEVDYGTGESVKLDKPLSFTERRFSLRHVKTEYISRETLPPAQEEPCIFLN